MSIATDRRPRWRRRIEHARHDPYGVVMQVVGRHGSPTGGGPPRYFHSEKIIPPYPGWLSLYATDDGRGLAIRRVEGDPDDYTTWHEWEHVSLDLSRWELPRLAWFLVRWFASDWFGLRTRIYFWALDRHLPDHLR